MSASTWVSKPICSNPLTLFGWCAFLLLGCAPDPTPNPLSLPTYTSADSSTVNVVIEIPAGSNDKVEIDKVTGVFEVNRVIDYLPYPINYGFIPSTLAGDGDALDVLVLSKRLDTGTVLSAIPIATMILRDKGDMDDKVLLVPADSTLRVVPCDTWTCLQTEYPSIVQMLEIWFTTYKPAGVMVSGGWVEAESTRQLILNTTLD